MAQDRSKLARLTHDAGVSAALAVGLAILLASVERHYPIRHWLFWRYALYWIGALAMCFACAAGGHALLRRIWARPMPWLEQVAISQALGLFAFQLVLFVLGLLRLYNPVTFFALPVVFLALGGRRFIHSLKRGFVHFRGRRLPKLSVLAWVAIVFGIASLIALYLPVMSPLNASFDARWRHLYIAEQYSHFGGIRRFDEGWSLGASPHFTSLLYAWGFMFPSGGYLFDRIELCAHIEYVIFLSTSLIAVPALVRRLVPGANPAAVWAARFLFPGTFLYDSNLSAGADHIGAVFAVPLLLVGLRYWRAPQVRTGLLLGMLIAAAICAKETTALLLAPFPILLVAVRFAIDVGRSRQQRDRTRILAGVIAGAATFVFTMPHWLKNMVWYGDPLYPNLHALFHDRPWGPHASYAFEYGFKTMLWAPPRDAAGLREAIAATFTFAFKPHGWWSMHRDVPVLGSLFTLFLLALPFMKGTRRIWYVVACVHFSVFAWFWVHHEDRHLQALVPWMAAEVAAVATLIWRNSGGVTRGCLALLIGAQAVWGADVYFIPTHSMIGGAALKAPTDLLGQGYLGNYERRFDIQPDQVAIGAALPKDAVILVHERRDHLGFAHRTITDVQGDEYGVDWLDLGSPDRIYAKLRSMWVSHAVWTDGHSEGFETLGGDIAFFEFMHRYTLDKKRVGPYNVAALPKVAPKPSTEERWVAVLGCQGDYEPGLYYVTDLSTPRFGPDKLKFPKPRKPLGDPEQYRKYVIAISIDGTCPMTAAPRSAERDFERIARRIERWGRGSEIWLRRDLGTAHQTK